MKLRTLAITGATLAALPATALLTLAAPASATDWNGVSPAGTVCNNDAQTVSSAALSYGSSSHGVILLRYSPSCRTAWAHIEGASAPSPGDSAGGAAAIHRSDGLSYGCNAGSNGDCYTAMVNDAGFTARAHGTDDTGFAIFSGWTGWY